MSQRIPGPLSTPPLGLPDTITVQNCTDPIYVAGYGKGVGVVLKAACPLALRTGRPFMGVGLHVKSGSERIPVGAEEFTPG